MAIGSSRWKTHHFIEKTEHSKLQKCPHIYMNSIFLINWNDVGTSSFVSFNIRISAAHYFFLMAIKKNQLYFCSWNTLHSWLGFHYQKIDKYKQKYRWNIFVGKFLRDFTDGNIPSVYNDGITVGKKFKTKQKKKMTCNFYRRNYRWKILSVNCEHCSSCQLQRESPTEFSRECYLEVF